MNMARALHFVFKIADRKQTAHFYRNILGMKVLRHEEFSEGCEAACNGPYANRWSKTMIGYGPEDNHFVIELTYNYTVKHYEKGNDFIGITIKSKEALQRAKEHNWPILNGNTLEAPGGYKFFIVDEPQPADQDPVMNVKLACSNLNKSKTYWMNLLGMTKYDETPKSITLGYGDSQAKLYLENIGTPIDHATAYGRIAFAVPFNIQPELNKKIEDANEQILTPLISLETPGKANVRVIILADPDGHEICFVDNEGFSELSKFDPNGETLLDRYINKDKSEVTAAME